MPKLRTIDGGDTPKPYHKGAGMKQVVCRPCEEATGVAYGGPWLRGVDIAFEHRGEIVKDVKCLICPQCLLRGVVTRVF